MSLIGWTRVGSTAAAAAAAAAVAAVAAVAGDGTKTNVGSTNTKVRARLIITQKCGHTFFLMDCFDQTRYILYHKYNQSISRISQIIAWIIDSNADPVKHWTLFEVFQVLREESIRCKSIDFVGIRIGQRTLAQFAMVDLKESCFMLMQYKWMDPSRALYFKKLIEVYLQKTLSSDHQCSERTKHRPCKFLKSQGVWCSCCGKALKKSHIEMLQQFQQQRNFILENQTTNVKDRVIVKILWKCLV